MYYPIFRQKNYFLLNIITILLLFNLILDINNIEELKEILESLYLKYSSMEYFENDPIVIPKAFTNKKDIEIIGFLVATIAWGNRKQIIKNGKLLCKLLDYSPYDFVKNATKKEIERFNFYYRTLNIEDSRNIIFLLKNFLSSYSSIGNFFVSHYKKNKNFKKSIIEFRNTVLGDFEGRTTKHFPNISKNSAAKRWNMFFRWMVRKDKFNIDFGIWDIPCSVLYCPLDLHSAKTSRDLGLLSRKQNDWKAVEELTNNLKLLSAEDPIKYDIALYGYGAFESNQKQLLYNIK